MSDDAARTADGRLFHARGAATENDNKDDKQYHRTARPENSRPRSTLPYHIILNTAIATIKISLRWCSF